VTVHGADTDSVRAAITWSRRHQDVLIVHAQAPSLTLPPQQQHAACTHVHGSIEVFSLRTLLRLARIDCHAQAATDETRLDVEMQAENSTPNASSQVSSNAVNNMSVSCAPPPAARCRVARVACSVLAEVSTVAWDDHRFEIMLGARNGSVCVLTAQ
jgi:hypothetical protein